MSPRTEQSAQPGERAQVQPVRLADHVDLDAQPPAPCTPSGTFMEQADDPRTIALPLLPTREGQDDRFQAAHVQAFHHVHDVQEVAPTVFIFDSRQY